MMGFVAPKKFPDADLAFPTTEFARAARRLCATIVNIIKCAASSALYAKKRSRAVRHASSFRQKN